MAQPLQRGPHEFRIACLRGMDGIGGVSELRLALVMLAALIVLRRLGRDRTAAG